MNHLDAFARHSKRFLAGNSVALLRDGRETYPSMIEAIASAQRFICLETYILASDTVGHRFSGALRAAAQRGVEVNLLFDSFGSLTLDPAFLYDLTRAGVRCVEYNPLAPWRPRWGWSARDHRKILVVDGLVGFTGGINISAENDPVEAGGHGWRDTHCRVQGPIVRELARLFFELWKRAGGPPLDPRRYLAPPPPAGDVRASILDTAVFRNRSAIRRAYLHAVRASTRSIYIANAYFLPDRGLLHALRDATRRGVSVQVMLPARSDVPIVQYAAEALYPRLLRWGVEIYEWPGMLHAKTAVIDERWSTVGSCNLDHRSFRSNQEANLAFLSEEVGRSLSQMFTDDKARCTRVTPDALSRRSLWQRWRARLCYFFRSWL